MSTFASLYCSRAEKIREDLDELNSKQKRHCQLATAELFPNETGKQQKNDKNASGLMTQISGS